MEIQHLTITARRDSRLPLFPDEARYRAAIRRLGRVVGRAAARVGLALFALVDEHLHLLGCGTRAAVARLGHAVRCSLKNLVATPLERPYHRDVTNRWHLKKLLEYFLDQPRHHGLPFGMHHGLFVGSCLPDLLGARRVDGLRLCISRVLPRYQPAMALEMARLPTAPLVPADDGTLRRLGAAGIVAASSAAFASPPDLGGKSPPVVRARRVAVKLARAAGLCTANLAVALCMTPRAVQRLAVGPTDSDDLLVVRRRIALEVRARVAPAPRVDVSLQRRRRG